MLKKLIAICMVCFVLMGAVLLHGCGGSGENGPLAALAGFGVILLSISAAGPSAMAFAASQRADIRVDASLRGEKVATTRYLARITPQGGEPIYPQQLFVEGNKISFDNLEIKIESSGKKQFLVEIFPGTSNPPKADPIFKYYFVEDVPSSDTKTHKKDISSVHTAMALAFEKSNVASSKTIDEFIPSDEDIKGLANAIDQTLQAAPVFEPRDEFRWPSEISSLAENVKVYSDINVSGTWRGEIYNQFLETIGHNPRRQVTLELIQDGNSISGTLSVPAANISYPVSGSVTGRRVSLTYNEQIGDLSVPATIQGVVELGRFSGTFSSPGANSEEVLVPPQSGPIDLVKEGASVRGGLAGMVGGNHGNGCGLIFFKRAQF